MPKSQMPLNSMGCAEMTPSSFTVNVTCAWCGDILGQKPGFSFADPVGTSSICPDCLRREVGSYELPNGKLVYVEDGRAWQRWPGKQWEEIDIVIIEKVLPGLMR